MTGKSAPDLLFDPFHDPAGEAGPVLDTPAVLVRSPVGDGRQEGTDEAPVRSVQLHRVRPRIPGTACCLREVLDIPIDVRLADLVARQIRRSARE